MGSRLDPQGVTELFAMGGHGIYVWSAYALTFAALIGLAIWPLVALRATVRRMKRRGGQR